MANKQTRRAVSLNRHVYVAASKAALRRGMTLSQLTTEGYRALGIDVGETHHTPVEIAERATTAIRHGIVKREEDRGRREQPRMATPFSSPRLLGSYLRKQRPGPIRRALGDAHADACGEPMGVQRVARVNVAALRAAGVNVEAVCC